jgi:hypothetical protein
MKERPTVIEGLRRRELAAERTATMNAMTDLVERGASGELRLRTESNAPSEHADVRADRS